MGKCNANALELFLSWHRPCGQTHNQITDAEHDTERTTSKAKHEPLKTETSQPHLRSNTQTKSSCLQEVHIMSS